MKKVLLVKITSMGDLIQMLPALTDAAKAIPGIQFDWLAEESFKEIPSLHPAVNKIITLPYRKWKKNKKLAVQSGEVSAFLKQIRAQKYDMIIDAQSNLKSAFVSMLAKGKRYGLDKTSVREYGAHLSYHKRYSINRDQNHAQRMRQMMAMVLEYELPKTAADYGIIQNDLPILDFQLPERFVFLIPIASCANKLWPEPYWQEVVNEIVISGLDVVIPWWSQDEKERALRLQNNHPAIHLLPSLNLAQKARALSKATAAISIDTGLAHMAAALNIPNICLYGSSNPNHCGTLGYQQIHLSANAPACAPCGSSKCSYQEPSQYHPACMQVIQPKEVISAFHKLAL
ncbi:MAG: lipopolysaccharide heptosyltransferase I [Legionella sp.]|jgi:heptosyltransferase-1